MRLRALRDVWLSTCAGSIQVGQRQDGVWAPLRDDRPDAVNQQHDAHYLDGAFHSACQLTLGCDVSSCVSLPSGSQLEDWEYEVDNWPMLAREYIQVGEIAVPECGILDGGVNPPGSDAGTRQVPQIETRAPSGALELMVRYRLDDRCQVAGGTVYVPIE